MPVPPFDRYIHILHDHVVKKRLVPGEVGFDDYKPDLDTLEMRDENEILALELVREHTSIPIPKVVHRGNGCGRKPSFVTRRHFLLTAIIISDSMFLNAFTESR